MNYFKDFPIVTYRFGNNESPVLFQNISTYVDLIDQIKNNISFYQYYHIQEGERADVLSYEFYETSSYHWTFFLMNDHLKEFGWPLTATALEEKIRVDLQHTVLTTNEDIATIGLNVGDTIYGLTSLATATVNEIIPDLGQISVTMTNGTFQNSEVVYFYLENQDIVIQIRKVLSEYNATHHFEDEDGNWVDIDPTDNLQPALYTEVTHADMYRRQNDAQREIVIIRPDIIDEIVSDFKKTIRG